MHAYICTYTYTYMQTGGKEMLSDESDDPEADARKKDEEEEMMMDMLPNTRE
jgi:hypothetical protein